MNDDIEELRATHEEARQAAAFEADLLAARVIAHSTDIDAVVVATRYQQFRRVERQYRQAIKHTVAG